MNIWRNRLLTLSLVCGILFFVTLQAAMFIYEDEEGEFDISHDFISNLGNEGETEILFFISLVLGFFSIFLFWYKSPLMFETYTANLNTKDEESISSRIETAKTWVRYNSYLGMLSSPIMPFIAFFSDEKSPELHKAVTVTFLILLTVAMGCYSLMICWMQWLRAELTESRMDDRWYVVIGIILFGVVSWTFPVTEALTPVLSLVIFGVYVVGIVLLRKIWQKYQKSLVISFSFFLSIFLAIFFLYLIPTTLADIFGLSKQLRSVVEIGYVYVMILWITGLLLLMATQTAQPSSPGP
ncbi:MAG: hypothetical protein ACXACI_16300 [Candidatus Hodarchaeales archaeon]